MAFYRPSSSKCTRSIGPSTQKRRKTLPHQQQRPRPPPLNLNAGEVRLDPATLEASFHQQPSSQEPPANAVASTAANADSSLKKTYLSTKDFAKKKCPCDTSPTNSPMDITPPLDTPPPQYECEPMDTTAPSSTLTASTAQETAQ